MIQFRREMMIVMENRLVLLDLSSPGKTFYARYEVFHNGRGQVFHHAMNDACITSESVEG